MDDRALMLTDDRVFINTMSSRTALGTTQSPVQLVFYGEVDGGGSYFYRVKFGLTTHDFLVLLL